MAVLQELQAMVATEVPVAVMAATAATQEPRVQVVAQELLVSLESTVQTEH